MAKRARQKKLGAIVVHPINNDCDFTIPFHDYAIQAGFPSPAEDYMAAPIDLNRELIAHPASTFMGRVRGDSMRDAGIFSGDLLIIDKSLTPRDGDIAVCFIDGEFTIKYIKIRPKSIMLIPANPDFPPIKVGPDNDFIIWGIVVYSIRQHRKV